LSYRGIAAPWRDCRLYGYPPSPARTCAGSPHPAYPGPDISGCVRRRHRRMWGQMSWVFVPEGAARVSRERDHRQGRLLPG